MTCHNCNAPTRITDIVCPSCHELLLFPYSNPPEEEEEEDDDQESGNVHDLVDSLKRYVPTTFDRFVRCSHCGQENIRGERVCGSCSYPLSPSSILEETVMIDEDVIKNLSPRLKEAFFKLGSSLLVLQILEKSEKYPCENEVEDGSGKKAKCGNLLSFKDVQCPACKAKNEITYNCSNADNEKEPCHQRISLDMMKCPACGESTLLGDLISIIGGLARGEEAIEYVRKYIQPIFPHFSLVMQTLPCSIEQRDLVDVKFSLQDIALKGSTIYEWLATYLRIATTRQATISMPTSISAITNALRGSIGSPPRRSDQMEELYARREQETRAGAPPSPVAGGDDEGDGDDAGDGGDDDIEDVDNPGGWGRI